MSLSERFDRRVSANPYWNADEMGSTSEVLCDDSPDAPDREPGREPSESGTPEPRRPPAAARH